MRRLGLWSLETPSPRALASPHPFCFDTLALEQWLQWVFLPRMRALIERGEGMPTDCSILPLAEEVFRGDERDYAELLRIISAVDELVSAGASDASAK